MKHDRRRFAFGAAGAAACWPLTLVAQGRSERVVTIGGAITEVAYALQAQSLLVGTDTTSLFPSAAQRLPKVGYQRQLSAEGLLSLRPDTLVASSDAGPTVVLDQVRAAGVRVFLITSDHTWGEVQRKVRIVGEACEREAQAQRLLLHLDAQWVEQQARVRDKAAGRRKPRVLFVLSHGATPSISGQGTAADAMIQMAGGVNALSGFNGYRPMTAEAMAAGAPDILLTTQQGIDALGGVERFWARPELAITPAFKRRSVIVVEALQLLGFGPRLPQTVGLLADRFLA